MTNPKSNARESQEKQSGRRGPKTAQGKANSSRNATRHGILGRSLLVEGEDPLEYSALLSGVVADEKPGTLIEIFYVEQIAQAIWRLKRCNAAEAAAVELHRAAEDTRKMLNETVGLGESVKFKDHHLEPLDEQEMRNYGSVAAILEEFAGLKSYPQHDDELKKIAPVYFSYLSQEAARQNLLLYKYLIMRTNLNEEMFAESIKRCIAHDKTEFIERLLDYDMRMKATVLRKHHQALKVVPPEMEALSRYRTAQENSLAKSIRALRMEQEHRKAIIEGEVEVVD